MYYKQPTVAGDLKYKMREWPLVSLKIIYLYSSCQYILYVAGIEHF